MKRLRQYPFQHTLAVLLVSCLAVCGCNRQGISAKPQPGPPVPLRSFVLYDVQGLFGGQSLWAAEDRTAVVQEVGPPPPGKSGLWEKRFTLKLTDEQWAEVERVVGAHPFGPPKPPARPGVPDEPRPIINVITKAGVKSKAEKWVNDKDPDFDPLYDYLLSLCRTDARPVWEGAYDWTWRPEGFEQPW